MDNKVTYIRNKPFIVINKGNIGLLKSNAQKQGSSTPDAVRNVWREDVLHDTTDMYFLKGEYQRLLLVNRYNIVTKSSRTIAKYYSQDGTVTEKTSDKVTEVIGQDQFNTLFTAICSILDQDLRIRSILALLTVKITDKTPPKLNFVKKDINSQPMKIFANTSCQTDEMRIEEVKPKRRVRKPVSPYIVQDMFTAEIQKSTNGRRIIVNIPSNKSNTNTSVKMKNEKSSAEVSSSVDNLIGPNEENVNSNQIEDSVNSKMKDYESPDSVTSERPKLVTEKRNSNESLRDLSGSLRDDNSNCSEGGFSVLSETPTTPELLTNPMSILNNIDQHTHVDMENRITQNRYLVPGTNIVVPYKPEDIFHIATADNLQYLNDSQKKELLHHQLKIDRAHCLTVLDEDGNLPIHMAVINNDLELVSRQCLVLKMRGSSLDIPANGLTPLELAVQTDSAPLVSRLVRHGATPLRVDAAHRTAVHHAAERSTDVLHAVLHTARDRARDILYEDECLWKPEMEEYTDEELGQHLMNYMCNMFDKPGYTPLMLASMLGLYENVRSLLELAPSVINKKMPTSGNTALYLAVAAACNSSVERGHRSKLVDHFRKTIEILLENGADPTIENHSSGGSSVITLLQEFNNAELSMLVANRDINNANIKGDKGQDVSKVMLILRKDGTAEYKKLENEKKKKKAAPKKKTIDKNLVIVENVVLKPGNTASDATGSQNIEVDEKPNSKLLNASVSKTIVLSKAKTVKRKSEEPILIKQAKINK